MSTYYLSGPMRGKPGYNRREFAEVESALRVWLDDGRNNDVINPARNFGGDMTLPTAAYMELDLKQVLESDVLVMLPGWRQSEGARREVELALWTGKSFLEAQPTVPSEYAEDDFSWNFAAIDVLSASESNPSPRGDLLDEAKGLITGNRNATYGPPTQDFMRSANALNAYGYRGPEGRELEPHDIAIFVMSVKLSRVMWTKTSRDNWVDIAGYAGCGWECVTEEGAA